MSSSGPVSRPIPPGKPKLSQPIKYSLLAQVRVGTRYLCIPLASEIQIGTYTHRPLPATAPTPCLSGHPLFTPSRAFAPRHSEVRGPRSSVLFRGGTSPPLPPVASRPCDSERLNIRRCILQPAAAASLDRLLQTRSSLDWQRALVHYRLRIVNLSFFA